MRRFKLPPYSARQLSSQKRVKFAQVNRKGVGTLSIANLLGKGANNNVYGVIVDGEKYVVRCQIKSNDPMSNPVRGARIWEEVNPDLPTKCITICYKGHYGQVSALPYIDTARDASDHENRCALYEIFENTSRIYIDPYALGNVRAKVAVDLDMCFTAECCRPASPVSEKEIAAEIECHHYSDYTINNCNVSCDDFMTMLALYIFLKVIAIVHTHATITTNDFTSPLHISLVVQILEANYYSEDPDLSGCDNWLKKIKSQWGQIPFDTTKQWLDIFKQNDKLVRLAAVLLKNKLVPELSFFKKLLAKGADFVQLYCSFMLQLAPFCHDFEILINFLQRPDVANKIDETSCRNAVRPPGFGLFDTVDFWYDLRQELTGEFAEHVQGLSACSDEHRPAKRLKLNG